MILAFFSITMLFFSFIGWGLIASFVIKIKQNLTFTIIQGLLLFCIISFISSMLTPLNIIIEFIFLCISILGFILFFKKLDLTFLNCFNINFTLLILTLIFSSTFYPFILDHFGYYIPTITLIDSYGLIKGSVNLNWTLGQQSYWHIMEAGLNNTIDPFLRINLLVSIIFTIYIYERKAYPLIIFIPLAFLFTQSPSPDLFIIYISLIITNEILNKRDNYNLLFLISVFAFTIKMTIFWLPLFVFILSVMNKKYISIKYISFSILIVTLLLFKNIYVSGLAFFPINIFSFNTEWSPNKEIIDISNQTASLLTYSYKYSIEEINNFSFFEKFMNWLKIGGIKGFFNILTATTLISFTIFSFIKKKKIFYILLITISLKCILIYLFSAQYRFLIDGLIVLIFTMIYTLNISKQYYLYSCYFISFIILISFCNPLIIQKFIPSFKLSKVMNDFTINQLIKPQEYHIENYATYKIGNLIFNTPIKYPLCHDIPQPAISHYYLNKYYNLGVFPQEINSNIYNGFYMKKLTLEEKEILKQSIINLDSLNNN